MSSAVLDQEQEHATYSMPKVAVGDIVMWFHGADGGRRGIPMVVEAALPDSVDLKGLSSTAWGTLKQGVRHLSDPRLSVNPEWRKGGAWDYSPQGKRLNQLDRDIERMGSEIRHLLGQINQLRGNKGDSSPKSK